MALGDDLDMRFHIAVEEGAEVSLQVNVAGNSATYTTADAVKDAETGNYIFSISLAAAQMTDVVTAKLYADGELLHSGSYTVKGYAEALLAETEDEALINLLENMLNYGGKAQVYFAYNPENLADAGITVADAAVPAAEDYVCQVQGELEGIQFYGAALLFRSKTVIRYYFTAENGVAGYTATVDGVAAELQEKDGMYYAEVVVENPAALDEEHTVAIDTLHVTYSGMHYIARMYSKTTSSEALTALMQAMYNYYFAAVAYQN